MAPVESHGYSNRCGESMTRTVSRETRPGRQLLAASRETTSRVMQGDHNREQGDHWRNGSLGLFGSPGMLQWTQDHRIQQSSRTRIHGPVRCPVAGTDPSTEIAARGLQGKSRACHDSLSLSVTATVRHVIRAFAGCQLEVVLAARRQDPSLNKFFHQCPPKCPLIAPGNQMFPNVRQSVI